MIMQMWFPPGVLQSVLDSDHVRHVWLHQAINEAGIQGGFQRVAAKRKLQEGGHLVVFQQQDP
jgi:hypothetical protein